MRISRNEVVDALERAAKLAETDAKALESLMEDFAQVEQIRADARILGALADSLLGGVEVKMFRLVGGPCWVLDVPKIKAKT